MAPLLISLLALFAAVQATKTVQAAVKQPGLIIQNKPGTWFSLKVSNPVVLKLGPQQYAMWAYGRDTNYSGSPVVSFGRVGHFRSRDGISWQPVAGPLTLGAVLEGDHQQPSRFDSGDVGVTDVIPSPSQGVFYMWYMGIRSNSSSSSNDRPAFGRIPATRGGVAVSFDGLHWARCTGPASGGSFLEATPVDSYMFLMTLQRQPAAAVPHTSSSLTNSSSSSSSSSPECWRWNAAASTSPACQQQAAAAAAVEAGGGPAVPDCSRLMQEVRQQAASGGQPCASPGSAAAAPASSSGRPATATPQQQKQGRCWGGSRSAAAARYHMFYNSMVPLPNASTGSAAATPTPISALKPQLFGAEGSNIFDFTKTGPVAALAPSSSNPAAFDSFSTGSARVLALKPFAPGFLLFYEAVDRATQRYSIGMARSADGRTWAKDTACTSQPGGPVLRPGGDAAWDYFIGTPQPLLQDDGTIFLYYVGFPKSSSAVEGPVPAQIGLAIGHVREPCTFTKFVHR